jgi:choline dehydrogenase-like flavoprotein
LTLSNLLTMEEVRKTLLDLDLDLEKVPVLVHRVQAKREIILSGGSFGSPHVLLNSGIGDSEALRKVGIKAVHDLPSVGRNLSDHIIVSSAWLVDASDSETLDLMNRNSTLANENLELWQKKRAGPLVDGIFNTVGFVRVSPDAKIFKQFPYQDPSPGPNTAHIELLPMVCSLSFLRAKANSYTHPEWHSSTSVPCYRPLYDNRSRSFTTYITYVQPLSQTYDR